MRDGVPLSTDVYGADSKLPRPVLLARTPYDKQGQAKLALKYAALGYAVVVQDCRGRYASGGDYTPYNNDRQDGYDTLEWIARQPWSNGKAGMFGGSHLGLVQWLAMAERAPGLAAIAPAFTASSLYRIAYREGALRLALIASGGTRAHPPPPPRQLPPIDMLHYHLPLMHLPLATLQDAFGWELPWMTSLLAHPVRDGFWRQTSAEEEIAGSELPVQLITGYYDFFHHETMLDFERLRARPAGKPVQLILGPWTHGAANDFGAAAKLDIANSNLEWFDRYLKGAKTTAPLVRYFMLGGNEWREADAWPPRDAKPLSLYLRAGGKLVRQPSVTAEAAGAFTSDPNDPTPSAPPERRDVPRAALFSPMDYSSITKRKDVLTFSTEPLPRGITFAGPLRAEFWVDTDVPDADWAVRVFADPPTGIALPLAQGITRAGFREGASRSAAAKSGAPYSVTIDLGSGAASLQPGSRLRIEISGSSFPMYDRNLHTGDGPYSSRMAVARQRILGGRGRESKIVLPVLSR